MTKLDEVAKELEANIGNKVVIWGKVYTEPTTLMRPTIMVDAVYGPNDSMPLTLVAIPEYPCKGKPEPVSPVPPVRDLVTIGFSQLAARGNLVWENGKACLVTPQGRIHLSIPLTNNPAPSSPSADGSTTNANMDVVATGKWKVDSSLLSIAALSVRSWPVGVLIGKTCAGTISADKLAEGEAAARETLVWASDQAYLKTESGPIRISFETNNDLAATCGLSDAFVVGRWKVSESGLYMSVRNVGNMQPDRKPTLTPQPPPSRPTLLPGEIASIGILVWNNERSSLETSSGKIYLKIPSDQQAALAELQGSANTPDDEKPTPMRLRVLAVGTWGGSSGELVMSVRYLQRWPSNGAVLSTMPTVRPVPEPTPITITPVSVTRDVGTLVGHVSIGPLCPVEPCQREIGDLYSLRSVILQSENGAMTEQKLNADESFKMLLKSGV
ncbi:MAG: hypothetical protein EXR59_01375 [Dehalococcoidia bacterium]|nr:hypothetical protein [Dehalococcoidia bacterium]